MDQVLTLRFNPQNQRLDDESKIGVTLVVSRQVESKTCQSKDRTNIYWRLLRRLTIRYELILEWILQEVYFSF